MLTGDEIKSAELVVDGVDGCYRAASYDLRVRHIVLPDGKLAAAYILPPQGIVQVVSAETLRLPSDVVGNATVKTSLCQSGVLALSIGLVDPGYDGPISSFLVNFGKNPRLLSAGDVFLRATFTRLPKAPSGGRANVVNASEHLRARQKESVEQFDSTFLNIEAIAAKSAEQVVRKYRTGTFAFAGAFALVLALMTFLLNFGANWTRADPNGTDRANIAIERLRDENGRLRQRIDALERPAAVPTMGGTKK